MTLRGAAVLAIWNDIDDGLEREFEQWHMAEHMAERLSTPGFHVGRRFGNQGLDSHRFFTLYEGESLDTFSSAEYIRRLDTPTPDGLRFQPHYRNFVRTVCSVVDSHGRGAGAAVATIRLTVADDSWRAIAVTLAEQLLDRYGICSVHVAEASIAASSITTAETKLRAATANDVIDGLVVIEGLSVADVEAVLPDAVSRFEDLTGIERAEAVSYTLSYELRAEDFAGQSRGEAASWPPLRQ